MANESKLRPCPHCGGSGKVIESFGDRLLEARDEAGLTQENLARKVGVSRPQLANLETGRTDASVPVLIGLAAELDKSIDWLLTGRENGQR
ncbi:helix-turn-helix domain-containing protein [Paradevosia shaoguanensis]|uniref:helix-turn-helix domain-containing protein n=1 Tax=Paradevosia shaoguanensis TaxID=1335043 RepID=UPI003C785F26